MPTNKPGYVSRYYKKGRNRIIQQLGGQCSTCGSKLRLQIHHRNGCVKPGKGRGRLWRLKNWREDIQKNELVLLCEECHLRS